MEPGLAQQALGPQGMAQDPNMVEPMPQDPAGAAGAGPEQMIDEIIRLLMSGVDPMELERQGVPPELIRQAIEIIMQQEGMQQPQGQPMTEPGLAAMA